MNDTELVEVDVHPAAKAIREQGDRIRELNGEVSRLQSVLVEIKQHWQSGVSRWTEEKQPWHGRMRVLLEQIGRQQE